MEALVIANQYSKFEDARLNGCYHDADNFISLLKRINPKMKITYMRDDLENHLFSSRDNILREFTNLTKSKNNLLFFYFSGHGTHTQDYNKDEHTINFNSSGKIISSTQSILHDSCLVTNDKDFMNIISDDEIALILRNLHKNKTLYGFLDCCHSGTGFDLAYVKMAHLKSHSFNKNLTQILKLNCPITSGHYPDKINNITGKVILLSATRDKDYAYESFLEGKSQGHFTFALSYILNQNGHLYNLEQFYQLLVGLINNSIQVPVLSCSVNLNLKKYKMTHLTLKKFKPKLTALVRLIKIK
jgi:hypothetical protein